MSPCDWELRAAGWTLINTWSTLKLRSTWVFDFFPWLPTSLCQRAAPARTHGFSWPLPEAHLAECSQMNVAMGYFREDQCEDTDVNKCKHAEMFCSSYFPKWLKVLLKSLMRWLTLRINTYLQACIFVLKLIFLDSYFLLCIIHRKQTEIRNSANIYLKCN